MFKKIFSNSFVKIFSYNSVVVFGKLIASFVVSKVSAIYLGPSGYAIVGNLKSILQGVLGITATGFESGIIKYVAENKKNKEQLKIIVSTILMLCILISVVCSLFLFVFSNRLSSYFLRDASLAYVFRYLAVLLPLISLSFLVIYFLNGLQKYKHYTSVLTVLNILNALLTFVFVSFFNLRGALIASILIPALSFISSLFFKDIRSLFFEGFKNFRKVSFLFIKSISVYLLMASYSSLLISLTYLFIRNGITDKINLASAGLWESMNKISSFYMIFFSSLVTLYLLPQLAVNKTVSGYYSIMKSYLKYLIPLTVILFLGLFLLRFIVIKIFLTSAFESIEQFFYLQLIGDFIKIIAFSIAYQFHAKKMVVFYFISDAILYLSFYFLSVYFLNYFDLKGVFYAYIVSTVLYFISVFLFVFFNNPNYLKEDVA